jgi:predicted O-linked N-acetylglucosamine transferase (SPINDLY family)
LADPDNSDCLHLLGVIAHQIDRNDLATDLIGKAIVVNDREPAYHNNLGIALQALGKPHEAAVAHVRAFTLTPDFAQAFNNLALARQKQGRLGEAQSLIGRTLTLDPDYEDAHYNLGNIFQEQGLLDHAASSYIKAAALKPDYFQVYGNLGTALQEQGWLEVSVRSYGRALSCNPYSARTFNNLAGALQSQGKIDGALSAYRCALILAPDNADAAMNHCFTHLYRFGVSLAQIADLSRLCNDRYAARFKAHWPVHERPSDANRLPRIGFVSADFRYHPVGQLAVPTIEGLARLGYFVACYSNSLRHDDLTDRFIATAGIWRDVAGLSDDRLADLIRTDRIDILIDLSGYSGGNRLFAFAQKPAPIQVASWIGCPATTGFAGMDYFLADRFQVPAGAERYYSEAVVRLPDGYVAFEPPRTAPLAGPLPAIANGQVTFGSFNMLKKITPEIVALWSQILAELPTSRLLLKTRGLDCEATRRRYEELFAAQGIGTNRLIFQGATSARDHLAAMASVDIALDAFPYSGGMTTLETLWMGVPVITMPGETFASRHSLSYLSVIGLTELIASDSKEYVALAVALARDLPRLAQMRGDMRRRIEGSPLTDVDRFTSHFAEAVMTMWVRWCSGLPSTDFDVATESASQPVQRLLPPGEGRDEGNARRRSV